jgi:hypothetical protein
MVMDMGIPFSSVVFAGPRRIGTALIIRQRIAACHWPDGLSRTGLMRSGGSIIRWRIENLAARITVKNARVESRPIGEYGLKAMRARFQYPF